MRCDQHVVELVVGYEVIVGMHQLDAHQHRKCPADHSGADGEYQ